FLQAARLRRSPPRHRERRSQPVKERQAGEPVGDVSRKALPAVAGARWGSLTEYTYFHFSRITELSGGLRRGRRAARLAVGEGHQDVFHPVGADAGAVDQRQRHGRLDPQLQGAFVAERGPDQREEHGDGRDDFHHPGGDEGLLVSLSGHRYSPLRLWREFGYPAGLAGEGTGFTFEQRARIAVERKPPGAVLDPARRG